MQKFSGMWRALVLLILLPAVAYSQEKSGQYIDKGLLRMQGNIAVGAQFDYNITNFYLAGDLEYYTSQTISIKGSSNYFLGGNGWSNFDVNHSVLLGVLFHFPTKGNFDPYIGIEPGFAISKYNGTLGPRNYPSYDVIVISESSKYPLTINPLFTTAIGFNFYADKYFSIFANVRLVQGKHYSDIAAVSLNEVRFAFGLGWHLWAGKWYCQFAKPEDL